MANPETMIGKKSALVSRCFKIQDVESCLESQ